MLNEWMQNPNQRSWLLLGSAFYVLGALKYLWYELVVAMSQSLYLQLWVHRRVSSTLVKRYAHAAGPDWGTVWRVVLTTSYACCREKVT